MLLRGWLQTFPSCLALKNYSITHTLPRIELPKLSVSPEVAEGSQQARLRRFSLICRRGAQQSGCELKQQGNSVMPSGLL